VRKAREPDLEKVPQVIRCRHGGVSCVGNDLRRKGANISCEIIGAARVRLSRDDIKAESIAPWHLRSVSGNIVGKANLIWLIDEDQISVVVPTE